MPTYYTVPELSRLIGEPDWLVRRVVDELGVAIRAGLYRLIPTDKVEAVKSEIGRRQSAHQGEAVAHA